MSCNEIDSAPIYEKKKPFREGWDCLKRDSTKKVLKVKYEHIFKLYINTTASDIRE